MTLKWFPITNEIWTSTSFSFFLPIPTPYKRRLGRLLLRLSPEGIFGYPATFNLDVNRIIVWSVRFRIRGQVRGNALDSRDRMKQLYDVRAERGGGYVTGDLAWVYKPSQDT